MVGRTGEETNTTEERDDHKMAGYIGGALESQRGSHGLFERG